MLPYAIRCFMEGGQFGYTLSSLVILYLFTILRYSFTHNSFITSAIALRFENLELLGELQRVNDTLRQDITERKQAQEELRQSEEKYRQLFETLIDVYYRVDTEGRIVMVSPSITRAAGYQPEELLGSDVRDLYVHPEDRDRFLQILMRSGFVDDFEVQ
jgi:PAS domain-containing protein